MKNIDLEEAKMSNDELRRILKVFGVSVTDFADEAGRIREQAGRLCGIDS